MHPITASIFYWFSKNKQKSSISKHHTSEQDSEMKQLSMMFPYDFGAMRARLSLRNQSRESKVIFSFSFYRDIEWHIYLYIYTYAKIVDLYVYINVKIHLFLPAGPACTSSPRPRQIWRCSFIGDCEPWAAAWQGKTELLSIRCHYKN